MRSGKGFSQGPAARRAVFTQHVRDLVRGEVTAEEMQAPWEKLRDALSSEMRQRGLFSASPACLGVYGFSSWTEEAVDELAMDCYTSVFLRRLTSLAAQLDCKANVEGLVFRNVRHYLHEIQRKHDPLGFRVYMALRAAVCMAVERGTLMVTRGNMDVRNDTVLSASESALAAAENGGRDRPALESVVRGWADDLLPELLTARGAALEPVIAGMAEHLACFASQGLSAFGFRDLSKLLKDQVRRCWSARWPREHAVADSVDRELEDLAGTVPTPTTFIEREAFEKLVTCVDEALEAVPVPARTRLYLQRLWVFMWNHAAEDGGTLPSQRQLAKLLDIPRARFSELYATLGRTVEQCRESYAWQQAPRVSTPEDSEKMELLQ